MKTLNVALFGLAAFLVGTALNATPDAPKGEPEKKCYALTQVGGVGGLWAQHDGGPGAMIVAQQFGKQKSAYIGLEAQPGQQNGLQFAIASMDDGTVAFQIRDSKGGFHFVPVEALLKLNEKK